MLEEKYFQKVRMGWLGSAETERRFERRSEFEHPKFSSEPSKFRAYLNLISIPIAETEQRFERASFSTQIFERAERVSSKILLGLSTMAWLLEIMTMVK